MVGSAIAWNYSIIACAGTINSLILRHLAAARPCVTIAGMRRFSCSRCARDAGAASRCAAADALSDARRLYNQGQYDAAERAAREAARVPATADGARVVLGRIQLERYRQTPSRSGSAGAIGALARVDARPLDARERIELAIGLAEALYLEDRFGAAAALFESVLDASSTRSAPAAHERVLDWWATAIDRQAQLARPAADRRPSTIGSSTRMAHGDRDGRRVGCRPGTGWRRRRAGAGDPERALNEATAGWVRAALARDGGAALRADLDRLVVQGILPDRAARLHDPRPHAGARRHGRRVGGVQGRWH